MSFGFNQIKWDSSKTAAVKEVVVRTTVSDAESGGAQKVLDVLADAKLLSVDAAGEAAKVYGRVNFKLMYIDSDGEIRGLDYFADFNENIKIEGLSGQIYGRIAVIDTDTSIGGGIKLSAAVEITLYEIIPNEVKCLASADPEYYVENSSVNCKRLVANVFANVNVSDETDVKTDVQRITLFEAKSYISDVTAGVGSALVNGTVKAVVAFIAEDSVRIANFNIPFTEEIAGETFNIGQSVSANSFVKSSRVVLTGIEGSNVIKIEAEVEVHIRAYEECATEIISDIFSVTNELIEKRATADCLTLNDFKFLTNNVTGIARLDGSLPAATEVIGVLSGRSTVAQAICEDKQMVIEGVYGGTILYGDETGLSSVELEIPFSLAFNCDKCTADTIVNVESFVIKNVARLKRDREIEVEADVGFAVELYSETGFGYIAEIAVGEEKEINKSAVSVYIASEGETLWDAAKALSARPDDILQQNPNIGTTFAEGDRVFYYRQINFEF